MCIYERVAMMGIGGAAIIGLLNPNNLIIRWCGFIAWGSVQDGDSNLLLNMLISN